MANSFLGNPIYIDDFSHSIDFSVYFSRGVRFLNIEWVGATQVGHKCKIRVSPGGVSIIEWTCFDVNRNHIKRLYGKLWESLYIAKGEVDSGKLILLVQ